MPAKPPAADAAANRRARRHPDTQPAGRRWATITETAAYLRITTRTVRDMISAGRLTGYRNGTRLVRVDLDEVDRIMEPFGGPVNDLQQ
jgi:excisionase family DNA binding protein